MKILCCLILILGFPLSSAIQAPRRLSAQSTAAAIHTPEQYAAAAGFAETLLTAVLENSGTPGISVAVGLKGRVIWSSGFGYADVKNQMPVSKQTMFRIGSVSKPLTAAAVGLLVERGRLDLDAPVQR
jgi:CubicO group peptidase (beta-lactamase class C family)